MTDTKHTPGPWSVSGTKSIRGPKGEYIAKANWDNGISNAHLIAAAPDLLEALEQIQRETARCRGDQSYRDACRMALSTSTAAIAKAKGQTS